MPVTYCFDVENRLIRATATGVLCLEDTVSYFKELMEDPKLPLESIEIIDFAEVTDFDIYAKEIARIAAFYQRAKKQGRIRATIFYCPSDVSYGIARMLEVHHKMANKSQSGNPTTPQQQRA